MARFRVSWPAAALVLVLTSAIALFATGHLQLQWRSASQAVPADKHDDADDHDVGKGHGEAQGRVSGDEAILDAEAIKVAGIRTAPVKKGSVAVALQVTGDVELPDSRVAQVTPRLAGVVREVLRGRGDRVAAGTALAVI